MHTYKAKGGTVFNHNQDLSGEVIIFEHSSLKSPVSVSGRDLLEFVAQYVAGQRVAKLEQAETAEILGVEVPED